MEILSKDNLEEIILKLDIISIIKLSKCNKQLFNICKSEYLWKRICERESLNIRLIQNTHHESFKLIFNLISELKNHSINKNITELIYDAIIRLFNVKYIYIHDKYQFTKDWMIINTVKSLTLIIFNQINVSDFKSILYKSKDNMNNERIISNILFEFLNKIDYLSFVNNLINNTFTL